MRPRPAAPGEARGSRRAGKGGRERWDWDRATVLTFAGSRREFVEREVTDFARQNPGVVVYVNPRPCAMPRIVAEYREWGRSGRGWAARDPGLPAAFCLSDFRPGAFHSSPTTSLCQLMGLCARKTSTTSRWRRSGRWCRSWQTSPAWM